MPMQWSWEKRWLRKTRPFCKEEHAEMIHVEEGPQHATAHNKETANSQER